MIFEIPNTKEKSDHSVASKNRRLEYQGQRVAQQERSQSDLCWTEACEGLHESQHKRTGGTTHVSKRTKREG